MVGTPRYLGRRVTSPEIDRAEVSANQQLGHVMNAVPANVIIYRAGGWVGRNGGTNATVRFAIHTTSNMQPGAIIAATGPATASTLYTDITGGSAVVANLQTPFVTGPYMYGISVASTANLSTSMREAQAISATHRYFYRRSAPGGTPQSLAGVTGTYEGHQSFWMEGETNVAPNRPTALTPSGSSVGGALTPVLASSFSDANETLNNGVSWDYLNRYQMRVQRVSDGAWMLPATTYTATQAERNARRASRTYTGSALAYNTTYRYEVRHEDRSGAWSAWATTTFSITSLSTVDTPSSPSGFITNRTNPGAIQAVYRHNAGVNANAMQARLLTATGGVLHTTPTVTTSVSPGGTLSLTWSASGFGNYVANGGRYQVQVRARDANGQWSPSWSPSRLIWFNAPPYVPTNLTPTGGQASGARPLLTAQASDPDAEQGRPLPHVYAEILNAAGTQVLQTRQMSWIAARSRYEYQTTAADLPNHAQYRWRAYSYDGHLYSGGATTAAAASRSAQAIFSYAEVPDVTNTTATVHDSAPVRVTWTVAEQTQYHIRMYLPGTDTLVYSINVGSTTGRFRDIPISGTGWVGGEVWNNNESFDVEIGVQHNGVWGYSDRVTVTLEYPPLDTVPVVAYRHTLANTHGTNAIRVTWEPSPYNVDAFERYHVYRTETDDSGTVETPGTRVLLKAITDQSVASLLDAEVTSRQAYRYDVIQFVQVGHDVLQSEPEPVVQSIEFDGVLLHAPADPEALHVAMRYSGYGGRYEPEMEFSQSRRSVSPIGSGGHKRTVFFSPGHAHDTSGTFGLIGDRYGSGQDKLEQLTTLYHVQNGDYRERPHTLCWREGRGGHHGRIYGIIADLHVIHQIAQGYEVDIRFEESAFTLGETGEEDE